MAPWGQAGGFEDRRDAGRRLAEALAPLVGQDALVLALPRGGVPVAAEVADALGAELDVLVARKLGAPMQPELGLGAVAPGVRVVDDALVAQLRVREEDLARVEREERREMERRLARYRGGRPPPRVERRVVVVVDDGVATGGTARAALRSVRRQGPARLVFAVPVGPPETLASLRDEADEVVAVLAPEGFRAVGLWYDRFDQTSDEEVLDVLDARWRSRSQEADPRA